MCFFFEDRELKTCAANPELWSGMQSDRMFNASLRTRPCVITPRDKPGSIRAGQSVMLTLKLDTVQGWSDLEWLNVHFSTESLQKLQARAHSRAKCWLVLASTIANDGTLYSFHESLEHTASNSRHSILMSASVIPCSFFLLTQSVTLSFTVLGLRGGLCMRPSQCSSQLVKRIIPCLNSCLYLWQWPSSKPVRNEIKNRRPATYDSSRKIVMSNHSLKFRTVWYKMM